MSVQMIHAECSRIGATYVLEAVGNPAEEEYASLRVTIRVPNWFMARNLIKRDTKDKMVSFHIVSAPEIGNGLKKLGHQVQEFIDGIERGDMLRWSKEEQKPEVYRPDDPNKE